MLTVKNLTKTYNQRFEALKGISFMVNSGQVLTLLGHNGAGKSTTLKIIASILAPDSGEVLFHDQSVRELSAQQLREVRRKIGFCPEYPYPMEPLTPVEYLFYVGQLYGMDSSSLLEGRISEMLKLFNIEDAQNKFIEEYSAGMKKRIAIAAFLINDPQLLLLDEPFNHLDPIGIKLFKDHLQTLKHGGTAIVLATHQLDLAEKIADVIVVLEEGRVKFNGALGELGEMYQIFHSYGAKTGKKKLKQTNPTRRYVKLDTWLKIVPREVRLFLVKDMVVALRKPWYIFNMVFMVTMILAVAELKQVPFMNLKILSLYIVAGYVLFTFFIQALGNEKKNILLIKQLFPSARHILAARLHANLIGALVFLIPLWAVWLGLHSPVSSLHLWCRVGLLLVNFCLNLLLVTGFSAAFANFEVDDYERDSLDLYPAALAGYWPLQFLVALVFYYMDLSFSGIIFTNTMQKYFGLATIIIVSTTFTLLYFGERRLMKYG